MSQLFVRVTSALSIATAMSFLVVASPAYAVECGDGQIVNGSFESPVLGTLVADDIIYVESFGTAPHLVWDTTNSPPRWAMVEALPTVDTAISQALAWSATEGAVEIQAEYGGGSILANTGDQFGEITGLDVENILYQVVDTVPGTVMTWTLAHRGLSGVDVMQVEIGATVNTLVPQDAAPATGTGDGNPLHITDAATWRTWTGTYTVPDGQTSTVFGFAGISSSTGSPTTGNLIDDIGFTCDAELTREANEGGGGNQANNDSSRVAPKLASTGIESNAWSTMMTTGLLLGASAFAVFFVRNRFRQRREH